MTSTAILPGDEQFMRLALREAARAGRAGEVPVGAVLVGPGGEVIARGLNRPVAGHDPTAHAEIVTLRRAARRVGNYRLPGTTLFVTVEPCAMCAGALVQARVARVVFGAADPKAGAARTLFRILDDPRLNHRAQVTAGVLASECREMIQKFFRARRGGSGTERSDPPIASAGGSGYTRRRRGVRVAEGAGLENR